MSEDEATLEVGKGAVVNFYHVIPIYPEEREYAVANQSEALYRRLDRAKATTIYVTSRPSTVPMK